MPTLAAERRAATTREDLLEAGTALILEKGYNHCGLDEILRAARARKGSFYHHFASKEQFGLEVVSRYAGRRLADMERDLGDRSRPPLERLRAFFEAGCRRHREFGYRRGCLFGNLGQELSDQSEPFRARLGACLAEYRGLIAGCLREAQEAGDLDPALDADRLAGFCLDAWEGALLRMKVAKGPASLEDFLSVMFDQVRRPRPA